MASGAKGKGHSAKRRLTKRLIASLSKPAKPGKSKRRDEE